MLSKTHYENINIRLFSILRNLFLEIPLNGVTNLVIELDINSPPKIHITQIVASINDSLEARELEMRTTFEVTKVTYDAD